MSSFASRIRVGALAAIAVGASPVALAQTPPPPPTPPLPTYLGNFNASKAWGFEPNLTPSLPGDVFAPLIGPLEQQQQFQLVQRLFDLWSWQAFLAVNWPTNASGAPAPSITGYNANYAPAWNAWHDSNEIYLPGGAKPPACNAQTVALQTSRSRNLQAFARKGAPPPPAAAELKTNGRVLFNVSAVGELLAGHTPVKPTNTKISEVDQAFSGPLFDQNGNPTFYEILMDNNEVAYLCANTLYSVSGQIAFSANPANKVQFPWGTWQVNGSGAFELKLAWKILDPKTDKAERFFNMPAYILLNDQWVQRNIGLVGVHIAHKTQSAPQWIWSTFEQIDNLAVDPVAHPNVNPSYYNPNCPTCLVNIEPPKGAPPPNTPVQVMRVIPIPLDKQALNQEAQAALKAQNSVWQYYQLIDTQWPTNPTLPPTPPGDANLPQSINNKPGGQPTPVYLTNATMETYFQAGNQNAANQEEGNQPPSKVQVFGTESCMGCHSSAGIAVSESGNPPKVTHSGQLTGDFSWLMQQKAQ